MSDWRSRQGKVTEGEIKTSLEYLYKNWEKFWYWRIMDYKSYYQINPQLFAPRTPSDFIAVCNGKVHFIEVKSSHSENRYGLSYVQSHQKESLLAIEKAGGYGWILLSWRRWPKEVNRLFAFRIDTWLELEKETVEDGFKSVSWNKVIPRSIDVGREKGRWKLERLFTV